MMNLLARFAESRAKRVLIVAALFFVVAGALGAGVANRLDPYGADDPDTESVIADQRLEDAGFRETGIVVLVDGAHVRTGQGRDRVEQITRQVQKDPDVASVSSFLTTGSRDFIARDGDSTYLAIALKPTDDHALQDAAERITGSLHDEPGVTVGGPAVAQKQVNNQVERDLRTAELFAFPLLFLLSLVFFRSRRRAAPAAHRRADDRRNVHDASGRERADLGLDLRPQPGHRARARAGHRLQPLHRLALSRGDRAHGAGAGSHAAHAGNSRADRAVQLDYRRGGARLAGGLPPAVPVLDGDRRLLRGVDRSCDRAPRPAAGPHAARRSGQRPRTGVPGQSRRARRAAGAGGLLVPPLATRHALPGPYRRGLGCALDSARDPVPGDPLHLGGCAGPAGVGECTPGRRCAADGVPALSRHTGDAVGPRRRARGGAGHPGGRRGPGRGGGRVRAQARRRNLCGRRDLIGSAARRAQPGAGP